MSALLASAIGNFGAGMAFGAVGLRGLDRSAKGYAFVYTLVALLT